MGEGLEEGNYLQLCSRDKDWTEDWHAPLHLNSPLNQELEKQKTHPVQHGQSCQITHTMLGSHYWSQPAQISILGMHSLFKAHWPSRGDTWKGMQWWLLGLCSYCGSSWDASSALIFCYKQCDSCPLSNRRGMHQHSAVEGVDYTTVVPHGEQERSMRDQFERWVRDGVRQIRDRVTRTVCQQPHCQNFLG